MIPTLAYFARNHRFDDAVHYSFTQTRGTSSFVRFLTWFANERLNSRNRIQFHDLLTKIALVLTNIIIEILTIIKAEYSWRICWTSRYLSICTWSCQRHFWFRFWSFPLFWSGFRIWCIWHRNFRFSFNRYLLILESFLLANICFNLNCLKGLLNCWCRGSRERNTDLGTFLISYCWWFSLRTDFYSVNGISLGLDIYFKWWRLFRCWNRSLIQSCLQLCLQFYNLYLSFRELHFQAMKFWSLQGANRCTFRDI